LLNSGSVAKGLRQLTATQPSPVRFRPEPPTQTNNPCGLFFFGSDDVLRYNEP